MKVGNLKQRGGLYRALWRQGEAEPVWDFVRDIWVYLEPVEHRDVVVDNALSDQRRMAVTRVSHTAIFRAFEAGDFVTGMRFVWESRIFTVVCIVDLDARGRWKKALLVELV